MANEQQAQMAEIEAKIEETLNVWSVARDAANAAEREVQDMMRQARELRERRAAAAVRANDAEIAAAERWRDFRQAEAQLKALQRRAGIPVTGAPTQLLAAHGIATVEAVGAP